MNEVFLFCSWISTYANCSCDCSKWIQKTLCKEKVQKRKTQSIIYAGHWWKYLHWNNVCCDFFIGHLWIYK